MELVQSWGLGHFSPKPAHFHLFTINFTVQNHILNIDGNAFRKILCLDVAIFIIFISKNGGKSLKSKILYGCVSFSFSENNFG
jgi:hypothetical protein